MQANSNVKVSVGAQLNGEFDRTFKQADSRMDQFGKSADDLQRKIGNVQNYRRQQNAVKQSGRAWQEAKQKADALRLEIERSGTATNKQQAALRRAEQAVKRTASAYQEARGKLTDMNRALERSGVNVGRLSTEYRRLQAEARRSLDVERQRERSLERQRRTMAGLRTAYRGMQGAVVGGIAAGAVLSRPLGKGMTYDQQLSYMADTAAGGDQAQYKELKTAISDAIAKAVGPEGGGKREDAASALMTLIASGKFEGRDAIDQLPHVTRTAFAAGAQSEDIAKTAVALRQFGINDLGTSFDAMLKAGQLGNFELRDMARWLPQQLAAARSAGYSGESGLRDLLAFNQVAMRTAGTQDEAGNNVVNLLTKFSSRELNDTIAREVKPRKGDPTRAGAKGKREFDWPAYVARARTEGKTAVEAFGEIIDRQMSGDKNYKIVQKKIANAKNDAEKREALDAAAMVVEGSVIGELIADRQALMAALAARYGGEDMKGIRGQLDASGGAVAASFGNISGETWAKGIQTQNAVDRANEQTYNSLSGPLGSLLGAINGAAEEFPKLTTAAYGAASALAAVAAAGVAGNLLDRVRGGKGGAGAASSAGSAASAAQGASKLGRFARFFGGASGILGLSSIATMTTDEEDDEILNGPAKWKELESKYGQETIDAARKKYQPWYQVGRGYARNNEKWIQQYLADQANGGTAAPAPGAPGARAPDAPEGAAFGVYGRKRSDAGETSPEAAQAVQAAQEAAKSAADSVVAVQQRPHVTLSPSYVFNITGTDPKAIGSEVQQILRKLDADRAAEARSSMNGLIDY